MKSITISTNRANSIDGILTQLHNGFDFIIESVMNPWCGKPANLRDLVNDGYTQFEVRYNKNFKVCIVKYADGALTCGKKKVFSNNI